jgi:hypothetical protein
MGMDINEPRCQQFAVGIDAAFRRASDRRLAGARDRDNLAVGDRHFAHEGRRASAIDNAGITDDEIVHGLLPGEMETRARRRAANKAVLS